MNVFSVHFSVDYIEIGRILFLFLRHRGVTGTTGAMFFGSKAESTSKSDVYVSIVKDVIDFVQKMLVRF